MPRALLVTDATWVINEVRAALALGSWEIEHLGDPERAVHQVTNGYYHALITDMQVGSMGGMAVIRAVRQATLSRHRPRLVLLLDRVADRFIAKRSGADAAVVKPIKAAELRRALDSAPTAVAAREEE